jgi:hypothetical protein
MDLAALNQVARLFRSEVGRDETTGIREVRELEDTPSAECEVGSRSGRSPWSQLALPQPTWRETNTGGIFFI